MSISSRFFPYVIGFLVLVFLLGSAMLDGAISISNGTLAYLSIFTAFGLYFIVYGWVLIYKRVFRKSRSSSKQESIRKWILALGGLGCMISLPLIIGYFYFLIYDWPMNIGGRPRFFGGWVQSDFAYVILSTGLTMRYVALSWVLGLIISFSKYSIQPFSEKTEMNYAQ